MKTPIRITSSPWGYRMMSFEERCRHHRKLGLTHICGYFGPHPGAFPADSVPRDRAVLRGLADEYGLRFASINADGDFTVAAGVEEQIGLCKRQIDLAAEFRPEVIIVFAGWQPREDDAVYKQVAEALKSVSRHAARHHLTVALENHGGLTATATKLNRILAAVNEPNIGINYDPANFAMYGADPLDELQALKYPVVFTHLKSLKQVNGKKVYCRLSQGEIAYRPILQWLRDHYAGFYALEYEEPADVLAGTEDDFRTLSDWLTNVQ